MSKTTTTDLMQTAYDLHIEKIHKIEFPESIKGRPGFVNRVHSQKDLGIVAIDNARRDTIIQAVDNLSLNSADIESDAKILIESIREIAEQKIVEEVKKSGVTQRSQGSVRAASLGIRFKTVKAGEYEAITLNETRFKIKKLSLKDWSVFDMKDNLIEGKFPSYSTAKNGVSDIVERHDGHVVHIKKEADNGNVDLKDLFIITPQSDDLDLWRIKPKKEELKDRCFHIEEIYATSNKKDTLFHDVWEGAVWENDTGRLDDDGFKTFDQALGKIVEHLGGVDNLISVVEDTQPEPDHKSKEQIDMHDRVIADLQNEIDILRQEMNQKFDASVKGINKIEIKINDDEPVQINGLHHKEFELILKSCKLGENVMLVGPAGSGKTTLAAQIAEALDRSFYMSGAVMQKYELTGFINPEGKYISSSFRRAFEDGGVFLWDEIDASHPGALVAFNAAVENAQADFPDKIVDRHPDFVCIAAANTFGRGATREYVGRNQLDAATLDRYAVIELQYDEVLEAELAATDAKTTEWVKQVQLWREAVTVAGYDTKVIISPRASIKGARLISAGFKKSDVEKMRVWKGIDPNIISRIKKAAKDIAAENTEAQEKPDYPF